MEGYTMLAITLAGYTLLCSSGGLPDAYESYRSQAQLIDDIETERERLGCLIVQEGNTQPRVLITYGYSYAGYDFHAGALLIPETRVLFFGAGESLTAYRLDKPEKLWKDSADMGFLSWSRHDQFVLMSAELELAAWDIQGQKRWSVAVEPVWQYTVEHDTLHLHVMDKQSSFPLAAGPYRR